MDSLELGGPTCDLKSALRAMFRCNQSRKQNSLTVGVCSTPSKGMRDNLRSTQTNSDKPLTNLVFELGDFFFFNFFQKKRKVEIHFVTFLNLVSGVKMSLIYVLRLGGPWLRGL